jgi:hypothetical protein
MSRFQTTVLLLLALLMPLRGMAAATMGLAPADAPDTAVHADGGCHQGEEKAAHTDTGHSCGTCSEHGCCASFLTCAPAGVLSPVAGGWRIVLGERFAAGFVPEHLDPPPLAL